MKAMLEYRVVQQVTPQGVVASLSVTLHREEGDDPALLMAALDTARQLVVQEQVRKSAPRVVVTPE